MAGLKKHSSKAMADDELGALVQTEIADAIDYDRSDFLKSRVRAIEYYRGEMNDLACEEGRSSVVTHDVADVIGWMLPSLMRVFFSTDELVKYEPEGPEDEASCQQASDYVNYVVLRECRGYQVFWDVFHDTLLHGNGIVKHWWDRTPKVTTHILSGLTEDQLALVAAEEGVEVLEHSETNDYPELGILHDVKISRTYAGGCLKTMAIPPEEFLIDRQATEIEDARFVGHRTLKTRSELIEMGLDREMVEALPGFGSLGFDEVATARRDDVGAYLAPAGKDRATEEVEIVEAYVKADRDGDGVAETLRVLVGGDGNTHVLDWEVWEEEAPFTDFVAERVPHRWEGRSAFDDTQDIQRVKSTLLRQLLDNLYQTNIPDRVVNEDVVRNPDALFERKIGNVIRVQGDPNLAVANTTVAFVAKEALTGLDYMDQIIERRTGVSRSTMALDMEALQNQSATAVNAQQTAAYSKIELIARNFAEMGFRRFFRCCLKLIVQNQDRPKTIRLRNKWVEMDPRGWNANMDATINVGLGSGSRDRDMVFLQMVLQAQRELLAATGGPSTPYGAKLAMATHHSMSKLVEMSGLKNPEAYFPELTPEDLQAMAQPRPDPEMVKVQAQAEAKQAEIQLKREEAAAETQLKRDQFVAEMALKREQLTAELALKRELGFYNSDMKAATSGVHVGGQPG